MLPRVAAGLLALCLALAACGAPNPAANAPASVPSEPTSVASEPTTQPEAAAATSMPAATAVPAAGSASGELVVYTSRSEALFKPVIAAFNTAYPDVTVTMLSGSNGELAAKLLEERASPKADVLVNSDQLTMLSLADEGVFAPNDSPAVQSLGLDYRAEDGSWAALTLRPRVIMYNTELVTPEELPARMTDLADPKWRGQIGAGDSRNGAMLAQLVAMRQVLGEETMRSFVSGLVANETQWFGSHTDIRKAVGAGEFKLGLVNHYYYHLSKAEGAPVGIVYPDQGDGDMGLVVNSTNAGIVQGGPNPELAKLFVEFMLSPEGQQVYAEQNFEYPIVPGVPLAEGVPPLSDFNIKEVSLKSLWEELDDTKAVAQEAGLP
jgi:iron(III) transport system substrate-binding protein